MARTYIHQHTQYSKNTLTASFKRRVVDAAFFGGIVVACQTGGWPTKLGGNMKLKLILLGAGLLMAAAASDAGAAVCARGYRGAGCAGPNGAVVVRRPPPAVLVAPAPRCYWRGGVRVCR